MFSPLTARPSTHSSNHQKRSSESHQDVSGDGELELGSSRPPFGSVQVDPHQRLIGWQAYSERASNATQRRDTYRDEDTKERSKEGSNKTDLHGSTAGHCQFDGLGKAGR
jgi:hypothetical protein